MELSKVKFIIASNYDEAASFIAHNMLNRDAIKIITKEEQMQGLNIGEYDYLKKNHRILVSS